MPPEGTGIAPEEVVFENGGLALKGYFYLPPGKGPFPCVVNNHGSQLRPGGADVSRPQAAALMMSWGYAFFFPHRRGYGDSPGEPLADAVPAPLDSPEHDEQLVQRLEEECADVLAAMAYARSRPEIDGARIALTGSSRGGIMSLLAAARDKDIRCAVNFSGGARQWDGHPKLKAMMLAAAHALQAPVFLAQAENDLNPKATTELAAALERAGKTVESRIYPRWGSTAREAHLFEINGALVWGPDVRAFLGRYLG
ncbi:MAG: prolyl oligopeptidase family serine peptidase [Kiloniellales bacterium]